MAELIDHVELDENQEADIREGGHIWIHDNGTAQDIELDAKAATLLLDFLLLHQDRLVQYRDAACPARSDQESPSDWKAIEARAAADLEAVTTDKQAYAFIEKYMSNDLRGRYTAIYRSDRHEMNRSPRQALDNLLSLPPLE